MPILSPCLIDDVESVIFSYITELSDIVSLLRINRIANQKVPLYITTLTATKTVPDFFFRRFINLQTNNSSVHILSPHIYDLINLLRMPRLDRLRIVINPNCSVYKCDNRIRIILSHTPLDRSIRICCNDWYGYRFDYEVESDTLTIRTYYMGTGDSYDISKYRTIKHVRSVSLWTYARIPSLETYEHIASYTEHLSFRDIINFIVSHPRLKSFRVYDADVRYSSDDVYPIITQPIELYCTVQWEQIPLIVRHFTNLKIISVLADNHYELYPTIRRELLDRGITVILRHHETIWTDGFEHPLLQKEII